MELSRGQGMATAALALGVISIISAVLCTVYIPFVAGGTSIVLACLSRGGNRYFEGRNRIALLLSGIGLAINIFIIIIVLWSYFMIPAVREQSNAIIEQNYGMTFEEMLQQMLASY